MPTALPTEEYCGRIFAVNNSQDSVLLYHSNVQKSERVRSESGDGLEVDD